MNDRISITQLIRNGGDPLNLGPMFSPSAQGVIAELTERTMARTQDDGKGSETAVLRTVLGLYAHAFMVGHQHASLGLPLPARLADSVRVPDTIAGLES